MANPVSDIDSRKRVTLAHGFDVAPNDDQDLQHDTTAVYCGTSGNMKVTTVGGEVVTITSLAAGVFHRIEVRRIWQTGTTATQIQGWYA